MTRFAEVDEAAAQSLASACTRANCPNGSLRLAPTMLGNDKGLREIGYSRVNTGLLLTQLGMSLMFVAHAILRWYGGLSIASCCVPRLFQMARSLGFQRSRPDSHGATKRREIAPFVAPVRLAALRYDQRDGQKRNRTAADRPYGIRA